MTRFTTGRDTGHVEIRLPRYRGLASLYFPSPRGGEYFLFVECVHAHENRTDADRCGERLARFVQRHERCPEWATDKGLIAEIVSEAGPK
jgi:hypothetical protein